MTEIFLTPVLATTVFVIACVMGYQYRRTWKREGPKWQLWIYGGLAAIGLLMLAFIPLVVPA